MDGQHEKAPLSYTEYLEFIVFVGHETNVLGRAELEDLVFFGDTIGDAELDEAFGLMWRV